MMKDGGFHSHQERIDGKQIRTRSRSFMDHYSQARLFFRSQTKTEQQHIINALQFELSKVGRTTVRTNMINQLTNIDMDLAKKVAEAIGVDAPKNPSKPINEGIPADADKAHYTPIIKDPKTGSDDALSIIKNLKNATKTRNVAYLVIERAGIKGFKELEQKLNKEGTKLKVVSTKLGKIQVGSNEEVEVSETFFNTDSVLYDALVIGGGTMNSSELLGHGKVKEFAMDAFNHCKPILVLSDITGFIEGLGLPCCKKETKSASELFIDTTSEGFLKSLSKHRLWAREELL